MTFPAWTSWPQLRQRRSHNCRRRTSSPTTTGSTSSTTDSRWCARPTCGRRRPGLDGFEVTFDDGEGDQRTTGDRQRHRNLGLRIRALVSGHEQFAGRQIHTIEYTMPRISRTRRSSWSAAAPGRSASCWNSRASPPRGVGRPPSHRVPRRGRAQPRGARAGGRPARRGRQEGRALPSIVSTTGVPPADASRPRSSGECSPEADVQVDRAERSALRRRQVPGGRRDPVVDRIPSGTSPPRAAQAAREGRRRDGRLRGILEDPRIFFAGYGPQASTIGANRAGRQSPVRSSRSSATCRHPPTAKCATSCRPAAGRRVSCRSRAGQRAVRPRARPAAMACAPPPCAPARRAGPGRAAAASGGVQSARGVQQPRHERHGTPWQSRSFRRMRLALWLCSRFSHQCPTMYCGM